MPKVHNTAEELGLTDADKDIIRGMLGKDAQEEHFQRFLRVCELTGLSAVTEQIYGRMQSTKVSRKRPDGSWEEKYVPELVIITGIDGFRAAAERTGQYLGQTTPEFFFKDSSLNLEEFEWRDFWIGNGNDHPEAARVGIIRAGFPAPVFGVARYASYAQYTGRGDKRELSQFWKKMPEVMLSKTAEALAFRKCFPMLAGMYLEEEIGAADTEEENAALAPVIERDKPTQINERETVTHIGRKPVEKSPDPEPEPEEDNIPMDDPEKEAPKPPQEPAKAPVKGKGTQKATKTAPATPQKQDGPNWRGHKIMALVVSKYKGRTIEEILTDEKLKGPAEVATMFEGFAKPYYHKLADAPAKQQECEMIQAAYRELFPDKDSEFAK